MDQQQAQQKFQQADTLYREKRFDEALVVLNELDLSFPNNENVLYPKALSLASLRRNDEAIEICDQLSVILGDPRGAKLKSNISGQTSTTPATSEQAPEVPSKKSTESAGSKKVVYALVALAIVVVAGAGYTLMNRSGNSNGEQYSSENTSDELDKTVISYTPGDLLDAVMAGEIALISTIVKNHPEALKEKTDVENWTALMTAAARRNIKIVSLLLDLGAEPTPGALGECVINQNDEDMAIKLIAIYVERGVDMNLRDNSLKYTVLHHAAHKRFPTLVKYLLENGADPNLKNKFDVTPLELAMKKAKSESNLDEKYKLAIEEVIAILTDAQ